MLASSSKLSSRELKSNNHISRSSWAHIWDKGFDETRPTPTVGTRSADWAWSWLVQLLSAAIKASTLDTQHDRYDVMKEWYVLVSISRTALQPPDQTLRNLRNLRKISRSLDTFSRCLCFLKLSPSFLIFLKVTQIFLKVDRQTQDTRFLKVLAQSVFYALRNQKVERHISGNYFLKAVP